MGALHGVMACPHGATRALHGAVVPSMGYGCSPRATVVLQGVARAPHGASNNLHKARMHIRAGELPLKPPGEDRALPGLPQGDTDPRPLPSPKSFLIWADPSRSCHLPGGT